MEVDAGDPPPPFDAVTAIDSLLAGRSQEETNALWAGLTLRQGATPKFIERCLEVFTDHARMDANDDGGEAAEPLARPYPGTRCTLAPAAIDAIKQFEGKYVTLLLTKDDAKVGAYLAAEAMRREVSLDELRAQLVPNLTTAAGALKQCVCGANDGRKPSQGIALAFAAHDTCGLVPASGIAVHDLTIEYMQQLMTSPPAGMLQALRDLLQSECWLVRFKPEDVALAVLRCVKLSAATSPLQVCRLKPTGTVTFAPVAITSRGDGGEGSFPMMQDDETMRSRICFSHLTFKIKDWDHLICLLILLLCLFWAVFSIHLQSGGDANSGLDWTRRLELVIRGQAGASVTNTIIRAKMEKLAAETAAAEARITELRASAVSSVTEQRDAEIAAAETTLQEAYEEHRHPTSIRTATQEPANRSNRRVRWTCFCSDRPMITALQFNRSQHVESRGSMPVKQGEIAKRFDVPSGHRKCWGAPSHPPHSSPTGQVQEDGLGGHYVELTFLESDGSSTKRRLILHVV